jgi:rSAM/selenodomain-associated transferase 2
VPGAAAKLSVIVPTLDEARDIVERLEALQRLRALGHEVIVADGGSRDGTPELARPLADRVVRAPRGRASQMNAAAREAGGSALVFLHADTRLPPGADEAVLAALAARTWGRFDVRIEGRHPLLRVVAFMMNLRSRLTGIATGDQAIFLRRDAFEALGGYAEIPLMEDVELSRRLRRAGRPACLRARVSTSGRRWESRGVLRTIVLMWRLRLAYFLGADPARLADRYR